jgi:excinuclease ABC subunit B
LVHNKTLASQLYGEFKELFPENRVEYFVSNFDFYQPEAYVPKTDTYIEKNAVMNDEIEMLRTSAVNSVLERRDTIVVASVAAIYGLSDPEEYRGLLFEIRQWGRLWTANGSSPVLIESQYTRNNLDLNPGTFRVHGDIIDIAPMITNDYYIRIDCFGDEVEAHQRSRSAQWRDPPFLQNLSDLPGLRPRFEQKRIQEACVSIASELEERLAYFRKEGKLLEAERLEMRTRQDMESLQEFGMCPGIENYSRHIDKRLPGQRPWTLMDYFPKDFLLLVDESHVTFPQLRGMYNGDRAGNRPWWIMAFVCLRPSITARLNFTEFEALMPSSVVCTSATPGDYELDKCGHDVAEQIIRPTGLLDPIIEVRKPLGQIDDLMQEIQKRIAAMNG